MKLSRFVRTLLVGILGAGILITPLLVFKLRFNDSPARIQAHVWSLWLSITWAAGTATYMIVDLAPWLLLHLLHLFGYSVERLQMLVEVSTPFHDPRSSRACRRSVTLFTPARPVSRP